MNKYVEFYTRQAVDQNTEEIALAIAPSEPNKAYVCYITVQEGKNWKKATEKCSIASYSLYVNDKGELHLEKNT